MLRGEGRTTAPASRRRSSFFLSPFLRRGVRGMIHNVAVHARFSPHEAGTFWLSRLRKEPSMRFCDSIFGRLLEPINRRQFQAAVDRVEGDAYDKSFRSWDHLVALIYAQLSGNDSLRAVVEGFN